MLLEQGIKAIFFVCPGLLDLPISDQQQEIKRLHPGLGDARISRTYPARFMNWEELKILKDEGHLIGAHGQSHQRLSLMDPEQARKI